MTIARLRFPLLALAATAGAALALSGCSSGSSGNHSGSGGSGSGGSGSGGSGSGSGGSSSTGGSTGAGGSAPDCTGSNDINYIVMGTGVPDCATTPTGPHCLACAQSGCHVPGALSADISGGLDLTLDSNIGSRLIGVSSGTSSNDSACVGNGPYLNSTLPPTGLLIDKVQSNPPCGEQMPWPGPPVAAGLTAQQVTCVKAWAEGLIMAAP